MKYDGSDLVKLVCRECENIEEISLNMLFGGVVISYSSCGELIVETNGRN